MVFYEIPIYNCYLIPLNIFSEALFLTRQHCTGTSRASLQSQVLAELLLAPQQGEGTEGLVDTDRSPHCKQLVA